MEHQVRQSEKMEAVGQLAGGIAHDFNNVLGGIIGFTDISLNYVEKDSVIEQNLLKVLKAADRAKHLVKQILAFSRRGNPQKSVISLRLVINEVLDLLKSSIPSSVVIAASLSSEPIQVMADPTQMHQAILNLATNAVQAMNRKGTLTVRLDTVLLKTTQHGRSGEIVPGLYAVIEVSDTGYGMDAVTQAKAFEPFFTTKPVGEGTGMGLSVVLGIVQSHGGDIQVESRPGFGTTFRIFLPVHGEATSESKNDPTPLTYFGTERILFVDDEEMLADLAKSMLTPLGYKITCMTKSVEALEFIKRHKQDVDLLITDQTMPDLTGIELAQEVLKIRNDLPIIICSGYSKEINTEQAEIIGIARIIMKPYMVQEISKAVREVMDAKQP
jgi:CheY-like chemotaxis protein